MTFLILKDPFYAFLVPLFILSSTSLVYYSFNFLPDIAALGFAFSGWYYIFKFKENNNTKTLVISTLFFTLSSLIKVTYLINPLSVLGMFLVERFISQKTERNNFKKIGLIFSISFFIVLLWNVFVFYYNTINQSTYFTTSILPIWDLTSTEKVIYWNEILGEWYKKYLAETSFHVF